MLHTLFVLHFEAYTVEKKKKQKCFPWSMDNNFNKEENAFLFLKSRKHFLQCCIINKHHNKLKKKKNPNGNFCFFAPFLPRLTIDQLLS